MRNDFTASWAVGLTPKEASKDCSSFIFEAYKAPVELGGLVVRLDVSGREAFWEGAERVELILPCFDCGLLIVVTVVLSGNHASPARRYIVSGLESSFPNCPIVLLTMNGSLR